MRIFITLTLGISVLAGLIDRVFLEPTDQEVVDGLYLFVALTPAVIAIIVQRGVLRRRFRKGEFAIVPRRLLYYGLALMLFPILRLAAFRFGELFSNQYVLDPAAAFDLETAFGAVFYTLYLMGEEIGWRTFLQPNISPGRPLVAAVATGVVWGVWHFPSILWSGFYNSHEEILLFYVGMLIPLSVIHGFLRQKTGSVWGAAVAHTSYNVVAYTVVLVSPFVEWVYYSLIVVIAAGILLRKKLLSEEDFMGSQSPLPSARVA
ncbi:MAG TPA: CPBP family intramembrane glutamic endopeptidase [Actinomycetota bacterium]|nr:CPBP family intramembrane glutamic endopeptidase [Actinomycetota bacterium]